jgi:hypothetical protein
MYPSSGESNLDFLVHAQSDLTPVYFEQGIGSITEIVWIMWRS